MYSNHGSIGYLSQRDYHFNVAIKDLIQEINNLYFELVAIQETITILQSNNLSKLDSSVGDWKCQTRTIMILEIINKPYFKNLLSDSSQRIQLLIQQNRNFLQYLKDLTIAEKQQLSQYFKTNSLVEYFISNQLIDFNIPEELKFLALCFLTTLKNSSHSIWSEHKMGNDKVKKIKIYAKKQLCQLSIAYTQKLAQKYGTNEEQIMLQQVETKAIQSMTCLFAEFKSIYKKMKLENQPFIMRQVFFCLCGGVQSIQNNVYTYQNGQYSINNSELTNPALAHQIIMTVEAYQYAGSLLDLQTKLNISPEESDIPRHMYQSCQCSHPTPVQPIQDIDLAMMAFFAQHPQFTNLKPIDFEGLGLANSKIKKEYDFLLTLPGFSRLNMTIFHINHMYPSTIAAVLQESEEIAHAMATRQPTIPLMQAIKPAQKIQNMARHIASVLCTQNCCIN